MSRPQLVLVASPVVFAFAALTVPGALTACGLGVAGGASSDGEQISNPAKETTNPSDPSSANASDASPPTDAAGSTPTSEGGATSPCTPTVVSDDLSSLDESRWLSSSRMRRNDYPRAESNATVLVHGDSFTRGSIWLRTPVPTRALDVEVTVNIRCGGGGGCGDGLAAVWLDTTERDRLAAGGTGNTYGLPSGVSGGGAAIDLFTNDELNEAEAPSLAVIDIDGTKAPGTYNWQVSARPAALTNGTHRIRMSLRAGQLTIRLDDNATPSATGRLRSGFVGTFGLTAANGQAEATYAVSRLNASFYACDPPN